MLGLRRELWFLFMLNLAIGFANQFIRPLFPLYLVEIGASEVEIGFVLSLASILSTVLMIPSGLLMNRIGKKRMLFISIILAAVPPIFISFVNDWKTVIPFFLIFTSSFSFFIVARMAMISEYATPANRASLFGVMNLAWPIGGIIAPSLSGFLIERYGWEPIFLITSGIMMVSIVPIFLLKETPRFGDIIEERPEKGSILDKKYVSFIALVILFHFTTGMLEGLLLTVLPLFLKNEIMISESIIGLFFTASSVLILFIQIPSGRLADSYGRKKVLLLGTLPLPFLYGLWLLVGDWRILLVLNMAANGFRSMTWPSSLALLADWIPPDLLGTAVGVRMTSMRLGSTIGPLIAGYLYSLAGSKTPFLAMAIISSLSIVVALAFKESRSEIDTTLVNGKTLTPASKMDV